MFSFSKVKSLPVKITISKGREDVQKQNSEPGQFFKCPICSFRTPLRGDLQKHISMYHKQVFVCKICNTKLSSKDDLAAHKELCPMKSEGARVYSCRKCGSKFDNAKIFEVHVKVTCLKGDFLKDTGKKTSRNFQPHNALEMKSGLIKRSRTDFQPHNSSYVVAGLQGDFHNKNGKKTHFQLKKQVPNVVKIKKPINGQKSRMSKERPYDKIFRDSVKFHKLPQSQGLFENDDKRTTMLSAFFEQQALHLESTNNVKTEKSF